MPSPLSLAIASRDSYQTYTWKADNTEALLRFEDDCAVLAFRGTTFDGIDIIRDIRSCPWYARELGCWVHKGFLVGVRAIWDKINVETFKAPVVLTGHSKGGAEAILFGARMARLGKLPFEIVTFGSPRCGFDGLRNLLRPVHITRYVNGIDAVAEVPTILPWKEYGDEITLPSENEHPFHNHRINEYVAAMS